MSSAAAPKGTSSKPPGEFDEAKLMQLVPPLTVNVDKIVAGRPQPIELPIKPDQLIAGQGWDHNDVRQLPTFLGRVAVGAGIVRVKVTDPHGTSMKWEWFFSPQDYERLPAPSNDPNAPPLALAGPTMPMAAPQPQMAPVVPIAAVQPTMEAYGGGGWLGTVARQVPGGMQPAGTFRAPTAQIPGAAMPMPMFQQPLVATTPDDRLREEREARLRLEGDMQRKELENRYKEQIGGVNNEVRALSAAVTQLTQLVQQGASRPAAEEAASAQVRAMEAQIAALQAEKREDKIVAMINSQSQQTQQLIASMQANTEKQIAAIQQVVAAKPSGPDPTMQLIMQMQKDSADRQFQFMQMLQAGNQQQLGPREWIDLTRSMNVGTEQQAQAFSKAWELMMQGVETILHAQGPGVHPALEMLGQGIQAAAGIGEKYVEMKDNTGKQMAQATAMNAQANMHLANQLAQTRAAQAGQLAGAQAPAQVAAPPVQQPPAAEPDGEGEEEGDEGEGEEMPPPPSTAPATEPQIDDEAKAARAKRDAEYFGKPSGLVQVGLQRLRKGVKDGHLQPEQAAMAIINGVGEAVKRKAKSPFLTMWSQGQLDEVIELMLPDAPTSFRGKVVEAIVQLVNQAQQQHAQAMAQQGQPS